ncbi:hypothetical protein V9T40_002506 [Parthenolecanium corni]|uniref:Uncharacterized protein n=1 Tax=Parthenolecanium corni TaxID=536013 RepID=A0AAN9TGC4_9HEMI
MKLQDNLRPGSRKSHQKWMSMLCLLRKLKLDKNRRHRWYDKAKRHEVMCSLDEGYLNIFRQHTSWMISATVSNTNGTGTGHIVSAANGKPIMLPV